MDRVWPNSIIIRRDALQVLPVPACLPGYPYPSHRYAPSCQTLLHEGLALLSAGFLLHQEFCTQQKKFSLLV